MHVIVNNPDVGGSAVQAVEIVEPIGQDTMANSVAVVIASDQSAVPVTGPLTDAQLRASPVPVSGTVSTGGLTDAELRASPVPVSGPLTDAQLRASPVPVSAASLPLPTGAATEATLATRAAAAQLPAALVGGRLDENVGAWLGSTAPTVGQKASASSVPVVIASDQGAVPISAASLPLPTGAATEATLATRAADRTTAAAPFATRLSDGAAFYDATKTGQLPAALVGGRLDENVGAWLGSTAPTVGSKTSANSIPVVIASDQGSIPVTSGSAATSAVTSVASSSSSVTVLASNANRKGATIYNDSTKVLYLKLGATASTTSYTVAMIRDAYFEVPFGYTGIIDGIWSAVNGSARVTEFTA